LLENSNFTYTYDENGNLTSKTSKANGEVTTYTYDTENQLLRVDRPGIVAEYRYDALGRRIEKVVNGVSTRYIYDNEDIAVEVDSAAVAQAFYLHGPGIDEPLAMGRFGAGGGTSVFHADGLGSITTLTNTSGATVRSYTYDSFGRLVAQTGTVTNPYTYTGRELDPESGLFYYRARYYDPTIGRFLQEDPFPARLQVPLTLHLYLYAKGSPVRFIDPFGLFNLGKFAGGVFLIAGGGATVIVGGLVIGVAALEAESLAGLVFVPHTVGAGSAIVLTGLVEIGFGGKLISDAFRDAGVARATGGVCPIGSSPLIRDLPVRVRDEIFHEIGAF